MRAIGTRLLPTVIAAAGLSLALGAPSAHAQKGQPPAWDTLVKCAQTPDEAARLACYDTAMRAAGYAPNPAAVEEEHRKGFGLTMPKVSVLKHHKKEEGAKTAGGAAAPTEQANPNEVEVTIDQVATTQPLNRLIIFTSEGQIWQQTDDTTVNNLPREGDSVRIHKEPLGGYFCDVSKYQAVRCKRVK
jgi:hypothetical protein